MTSGGQCVMTAGATLMQLWSASSWDMDSLKVSGVLKKSVFVQADFIELSS